MDPYEIAEEVDKAGDQIMQAALQLQDEGRRIRDIAADIRFERRHPDTLGMTMSEIEVVLDIVQREVRDAVAIIRRTPYESNPYG